MRCCLLLLLICLMALPARSQTLLLETRHGDLCSTCRGDLACAAADGTVTRIALLPLDLLGQMLTVFDYLPGLGGRMQSRPAEVTIADGTTRPTTARIGRKAARIEVDGWVIDRTDGGWSDPTGKPVGRCSAVAS